MMSDVTLILDKMSRGDRQDSARLLTLVYRELRKLAAQKIDKERPGQTLQATALVHEAYIRLVDGPEQQAWENRGHFFAAAAEAMRRILIEQARRKQSLKRGGDWQRVELQEPDLVTALSAEDLVALDDALDKLTETAELGAQIVKLRCFAGLTLEEAAAALDVSRATASKHWAFAKAWLYKEMRSE